MQRSWLHFKQGETFHRIISKERTRVPAPMTAAQMSGADCHRPGCWHRQPNGASSQTVSPAGVEPFSGTYPDRLLSHPAIAQGDRGAGAPRQLV